MGATLGIHWIVTTFGTWLHGDPRGSWRDGKLIGADPFLEDAVRHRMTTDAVALSRVETILVASTFGQAIMEAHWRVYAATICATHAHLVFGPVHDPIHDVIATLKYRASCAVHNLRRTMFQPIGRSLWTEGQFPVFIYDESHLRNAIEYVRNHNRRIRRDADPYDWIQPLYPASTD